MCRYIGRMTDAHRPWLGVGGASLVDRMVDVGLEPRVLMAASG